jgi:hypothetical protein
MFYKIALAVLAALLLSIAVKQSTAEWRLQPAGWTEVAPSSQVGCADESGAIRAALAGLSSREYAQVEQAKKTLLNYSKKSPACRNKVVRSLMEMMDKPDLDLERDISSYIVWREGSRLLGELKATEALDLLISHLDLTNGFHSASMVFQPAVLGVRQMGEAAIPKLAVALRESPKPGVRKAAVYCLTAIGGATAMDVLKQAQASESNECVARYIEISLSTFSYKSKSGPIRFDNDAPQADAEARQNWLAAFRCEVK